MGDRLCASPALTVTRDRIRSVGAEGMTKYSGFFNAIKTMFRKEGIGSFYKGGALNAVATPPARGMYMAGVEISKATIGGGTVGRDFCAGAMAQLISSLAYVPRDVVVERCAIDGQLKSQIGSAGTSAQVLRTIWQTERFAGFYRAYLPHQLVWIPYNGLFFSALGKVTEFEQSYGIDTSSYWLGVANTFCCGAAAGWATTPIDVVKTRLQVQGANPEMFAFNGVFGCFTQLIKHEGPASLFAGATGRMAYLAPNMALFIPLYDVLKGYATARDD